MQKVWWPACPGKILWSAWRSNWRTDSDRGIPERANSGVPTDSGEYSIRAIMAFCGPSRSTIDPPKESSSPGIAMLAKWTKGRDTAPVMSGAAAPARGFGAAATGRRRIRPSHPVGRVAAMP